MHKPIKYAEKALTYAAGAAWFVFGVPLSVSATCADTCERVGTIMQGKSANATISATCLDTYEQF